MTTKDPLRAVQVFDIEKEMQEIMTLPCNEAMLRIWALHRMLKPAANELHPLCLICDSSSPHSPK
jgi:hypothetical protein